ncbi:hypothetical protein JY651_18900 [Pyxidicoccus parkwayensis]|uniref:Lipoprotein n=1 Tax=Pyxidicoccus parkwayensis TaxID=2813578 RepID=A0ABX7P8N2_9BACT|nr:hypothetical protein [Pyxidicoccus parkwaysis]QSQ26854.1 hypothetical protein JY651_18900 [Pyxidicoccus parkwaysis]
MSRLLSFALCCVLAPAVGRSQEAPTAAASAVQEPRLEVAASAVRDSVPDAPADSTSRADGAGPVSDAPLREERPSVDEAPAEVTSRPLGPGRVARRVAAEVFIGGGASVAGLFTGQALFPGSPNSRCEGCAKDYSTEAVLGAGLCSGLGVYTAGRLMGGQGDFLATMAGAGLGTGGALLMFGTADDRLNNTARTFTALLLPLAGAMTAYELSHALAGFAPSTRWSKEAPSLVPVASTTKDGGVLGGLVGMF